jgi:hypothetical protein
VLGVGTPVALSFKKILLGTEGRRSVNDRGRCHLAILQGDGIRSHETFTGEMTLAKGRHEQLIHLVRCHPRTVEAFENVFEGQVQLDWLRDVSGVLCEAAAQALRCALKKCEQLFP